MSGCRRTTNALHASLPSQAFSFVLRAQQRRWLVMLEVDSTSLSAVELEEAPSGVGPTRWRLKQWHDAHAAGKTNADSVLLMRNCRRDRSLAEGVIQGCNLISTVSASSV